MEAKEAVGMVASKAMEVAMGCDRVDMRLRKMANGCGGVEVRQWRE